MSFIWLGKRLVLCFPLLAFSVGAEEGDVIATDRTLSFDGILEEWGAPQNIPIRPGGKLVGVRGAFEGAADHEVDLYLMWGAEFLYVAVMVADDTLDVGRVKAGGNVWEGPGGQRKDRMFYYDHLKVFLRGPKAPLGYNMWISPSDGEQDAYLWGAQQWSAASADLPVQVGSARAPGVYTYELEIPWKWLDIHPQPGMHLDAMFLLPDSDLPGVPLEEKIARSNKWIWWKGKIVLRGEPPGWKPPPASVVEQIQEGIKAFKAPQIKEKADPVGEDQVAVAPQEGSESGAESNFAGEDAERAIVDEQAEVGQAEVAAAHFPDLAALNRRLLAPKTFTELPVWARGINSGVTPQQEVAFLRNLASNLYRVNRQGVSSRLDILIIDMADSAGTEKRQAHHFMLALLDRLQQELKNPQGLVCSELATRALKAGIEEERALRLVREICSPAQKFYKKFQLYSGGKAPTTGELEKRGRRKAGLSDEQMKELLRLYLQDWGG